mgnify:CR=1 FL=1
MWKTGHSYIKSKLAEEGAALAGEMSGHIFFGERWYGFDDGLYAGARLLEILTRSADPSAVLNALPNSTSTPELQLKVGEGENHALVERLRATAKFDGAREVIGVAGQAVRAVPPREERFHGQHDEDGEDGDVNEALNEGEGGGMASGEWRIVSGE